MNFTKKQTVFLAAVAFLLIAAVVALLVWQSGGFRLLNADKKTGTPPSMTENQDLSSKINNGILNLSDCGALPDSDYEHGPLIRSALATVIKNPGTQLHFEKGEYIVSPTSADSGFLFDLADEICDGLTIKGNGAKIINTDPFSGMFRFRDSKDISIAGLIFDYSQLPWLQGTITEIDERQQRITVEWEDDNPLMDDPRYKDYTQYIYGTVRDAKNTLLIKADCPDFFFYAGHTKLGERRYQIQINKETTPYVGQYIKTGDKITLNNRGIANASVFDVLTCGSINIKNVDVYAQNGTVVLGQFMTGAVTVDNLKVTYPPDAKGKRWITGNSDVVHIQGGTHGVTVTNCLLEGLTDDGINLYQNHSVVSEVISDTKIKVASQVGFPEVGMSLDIYNSRDGILVGSPEVAGITKDGLYNAEITFKTPVTGITAGTDKTDADIVVVQEFGLMNSRIADTTFRNIRMRPIIIRNNNAVIEDCVFENISAQAIRSHFWGFEGLGVRNLVIRRNKMKNIYYNFVNGFDWMTPEQSVTAAITIQMEKNDTITQAEGIFHDNIVIENNNITDYHKRAIQIGNAKNVVIKNNTFAIQKAKTLYGGDEGIYVNKTDSIEITGNDFKDNRAGVKAAVRYDENSVKGINIHDNQFAAAKDKQVIKQ